MTDSPGPPPLAPAPAPSSASAPVLGLEAARSLHSHSPSRVPVVLPQMPPKHGGGSTESTTTTTTAPMTVPNAASSTAIPSPHFGPSWASRVSAGSPMPISRPGSGTPPALPQTVLPQYPAGSANSNTNFQTIGVTARVPHPGTSVNGHGSPAPTPNHKSYMPARPNSTQTPRAQLETRYTTEEKGKGRAPANASHGGDDEGRGKREKKKRRLSGDSVERVRPDRPFVPPPPPMPQAPTRTLPVTADDKAYFQRVDANKARPPLSDMCGPCPVWSNTRRGLQSAVQYLRNPGRTGGASVDIGPGGLARGVILEGQTPTDLVLWDVEDVWTFLLPIGRPRARRQTTDLERKPDLSDQPAPTPSAIDSEPAADHLDPDADAAENHYIPAQQPERFPSLTSKSAEAAKPDIAKRPAESAEIEALILTHRARIPIALTVSQDYTGVPFKVPRPFIALGWFWITDAWVEPVVTAKVDQPEASGEIDPDRVVWRFRFEYCRTPTQSMPWWQSLTRAYQRPSCQYIGVDEGQRSWPLIDAEGSATTTVTKSSLSIPTSEDGVLPQTSSRGYECPACSFHTSKVYRNLAPDMCLNETCPTWTKTAEWFRCPRAQWPERFRAADQQAPIARITPESLRLILRQPEPGHIDPMSRSQPANAGREYWQGWVCHKCGCANERKRWHGWSCDGCRRTVVPRHIVYSDDTLRAPLRPISTGPRPDDGLASWPSTDVTFAWTLFDDDIKVVRHGLENVFGAGIVVYHSLNHEGPKLSQRRINAKSLFRDLQYRAELAYTISKEMPYMRHPANPQAARPSERHLSPFYTVVLGPEPAPQIESLPTASPIPWREANETFLSLADYLNERAGQIFPGEPEFNSLLIALTPPDLPATQAPRIFIPAHAYVTFAFFGSDGVLKIRRPAGSTEGKSKQGQMTLQHGDVVGVQTGPTGLEVSAQQDGFGFLCIGRQIYRMDSDLIPNRSLASPNTGDKVFHHARPRKLPNKPPPKPSKLPHVPLTYWYVGPFPLDPERPLRVNAALRNRGEPLRPIAPPATADADLTEGEAEGKKYTGVEEVEADLPHPKKLDPPVRPGESGGRKRKTTGSANTTTDQNEGNDKGQAAKVKGAANCRTSKVADRDEEQKSGPSPAKKKARKSAVVS